MYRQIMRLFHQSIKMARKRYLNHCGYYLIILDLLHLGCVVDYYL